MASEEFREFLSAATAQRRSKGSNALQAFGGWAFARELRPGAIQRG